MRIVAADAGYVMCPECGGHGETMVAEMRPNGHTEVMYMCDFCDGEGQFTEADYIVMKLAGEV